MTCEDALRKHREERAKRANKGATGPMAKAVLISFRNVSGINTETVVSRFHELRILSEQLSQMESALDWRLSTDSIRPTLKCEHKKKRRATPEFTDSEFDDQCI